MMRQRLPSGDKKIQQIVGIYDALSAKIAHRLGFDWLHVGGYNVSGAAFGMPDIGVVTQSEMVDVVWRITDSTDTPVLVDGDNGYGNYLNVMRLVREVERTGASGIHMEDQVMPKRCGHMEGKRVVRPSEFIGKIKAFVDTRKTEKFLLFARTDALAVKGFDDAIDRANLYLDAGADVIFVEAPVTIEQVEKIPKLVKGPVLYNWVLGGKSPLVHPKRLAEYGYNYWLQADVLYAVSKVLERYFRELKEKGTYGEMQRDMISFSEFNDIVGLQRVLELEAEYEQI